MDKRSTVREGDIKEPVAANRCDVNCQMRFKERTEDGKTGSVASSE